MVSSADKEDTDAPPTGVSGEVEARREGPWGGADWAWRGGRPAQAWQRHVEYGATKHAS